VKLLPHESKTGQSRCDGQKDGPVYYYSTFLNLVAEKAEIPECFCFMEKARFLLNCYKHNKETDMN
jgi:hypothetical protein